jgi:hypothetical protein
MPYHHDPLLLRAAAVLENSKRARTEMQVRIDQAKLLRLQRELAHKLLRIERIVFREM